MSLLVRMRGLIVVMLMVAAGFSNQTNAASIINLSEDGWHSWRVASVELAVEETIYVLVNSGEPKEIEIVGEWCNGRWHEQRKHENVIDLGLLSVDASIDWLQQHIGARTDLSSDALAAISRHAGDRSLQILIDIVESDAHHEIREEAVFWIAMSEYDKAFDYINGLLMSN